MIGVESQNALLIQIVQPPLHVEMKNVSILVIVLRMLIALQGIIGEYVTAKSILLAILTASLVG